MEGRTGDTNTDPRSMHHCAESEKTVNATEAERCVCVCMSVYICVLPEAPDTSDEFYFIYFVYV